MPRMVSESDRWRQFIGWVRNRSQFSSRKELRRQYVDLRLTECPECCALLRQGAYSYGLQIDTTCDCCSNCSGCCCECFVCRRCSHRSTSVCDGCERCSDCCACRNCDDCGSRVQDRCTDCLRCGECGCTCGEENRMPRFEQKVDLKRNVPSRLQRKVNPSARLLAAEIEVAGVESDDGVSSTIRKWGGSIVDDRSLPDEGFEINTAPAGGDLFVRQITDICRALAASGGKVNNSCGLHVHIDANDMDYYGIRRLVKIYSRIESLVFQMVPESRRKNSYCQPCGDAYMVTIGRPLTEYKETKRRTATMVYGSRSTKGKRSEKYGAHRYNALNLHSWFYRGTVEIRLFPGTTNASKIVPWGMLWAAILDRAHTSTEAEIESLCARSAYQVIKEIVGPGMVLGFVHARLIAYGTQALKDEIAGKIASDEVYAAAKGADEARLERAAKAREKEEITLKANEAENERLEAQQRRRNRAETVAQAARIRERNNIVATRWNVPVEVIDAAVRLQGQGNECLCGACMGPAVDRYFASNTTRILGSTNANGTVR